MSQDGLEATGDETWIPDASTGGPAPADDTSLRAAFVARCQSGTPGDGDVFAFLAEQPERDLEEELEVVRFDLARCFDLGIPIRVEDYVKARPRLATSPKVLTRLIEEEYRLRLAHGESPRIEEYAARFPHLAADLAPVVADTLHSYDPGDTADPVGRTADWNADPEQTASAGRTSNVDATNAEISERFGDYDLFEELGRGGMGVVYRARQRSLGRQVALKMIRSGELAGRDEVERFLGEARAAARLDHPGIVPVFEVGEVEGRPFFSMGHVQGHSLSADVREGPLDPRRAAQLARKIAEAVHYAHTRGIVHRDLKPSNVLVDEDDEPHVLDFGLAKVQDGGSGLTVTGEVLGTPAYMPPEQASGRISEVGPLSDVYSVGALLYHLLTGRPPFQAATVVVTLQQVIDSEPVSLRRLNTSVPADLETVCLKCLAKEPARRYESAAALAEDLGRYLEGRPIDARPVGAAERAWRWCRRHPAVASLLTTTLLLAVGVAVAASVGYASTVMALGEAREQTERALRAEGEANQQRKEVARQRDALRRELDVSHSLRLASDSRLARPAHAQRSLLLGIAALEATPAGDAGHEAERNLREALATIGGHPLVGHGAKLSTFGVSRDDRWLVTGDVQGGLRRWDLTAEDPAPGVEFLDADTASESMRHGAFAVAAVFSPGGKWLATAHLDAASSEAISPELTMHKQVTRVGSLWPDEVVDGTVLRLWRFEKGEFELVESRRETGRALGLRFSEDERFLFVEHHGAGAFEELSPSPFGPRRIERRVWKVDVWDLESGVVPAWTRVVGGADEKNVPPKSGTMMPSTSATPDGSEYLVGLDEGVVEVWDFTSDVPSPRRMGLGNVADADANGAPIRGQRRFGSAHIGGEGRWVAMTEVLSYRVWGRPRLAERNVHLFETAAALDQTMSARHVLEHPSDVRDVDGNAEGTTVVVGCADGRVHFWDTSGETARELPVNGRHLGSVDDVRLSLRPGRFFTHGRDDTILVWEIVKGIAESKMLRLPGHGLRMLDEDPGGRWLATVGGGGRLVLWDLDVADPGGRPLELDGHEGEVAQAKFTDRWLVTLSGDEACRLWDLTQLHPGASPRRFGDATGARKQTARLDPEGRWVLANRGTSYLCDLGRGFDFEALPERIPVNRTLVDATASTLVIPQSSTSKPKVLRRVAGGWRSAVLDEATGEPEKTLLSADGRTVAVVSKKTILKKPDEPTNVRVWDLSSFPGEVPSRLVVDGREGVSVVDLALDDSALLLAEGNRLHVVGIWDDSIDATFVAESPLAWRGTSQSAGGHVAVPLRDRSGVVVWDPRQPESSSFLRPPSPEDEATTIGVDAVLLSPRGDRALVVLELKRETTLKEAARLPGGWSRGKTYRVSHELVVYNLPSGDTTRLGELEGSRLKGREWWFDDDGTCLVVRQGDHGVMWRETPVGWKKSSLVLGSSRIVDVGFPRDGRQLVVRESDGTIRLIDVQSVDASGRVLVHESNLANRMAAAPSATTVAVGAAGSGIVAVDANGTVYSWPVESAELVELARRVAGRELREDERSSFGLEPGNVHGSRSPPKNAIETAPLE